MITETGVIGTTSYAGITDCATLGREVAQGRAVPSHLDPPNPSRGRYSADSVTWYKTVVRHINGNLFSAPNAVVRTSDKLSYLVIISKVVRRMR